MSPTTISRFVSLSFTLRLYAIRPFNSSRTKNGTFSTVMCFSLSFVLCQMCRECMCSYVFLRCCCRYSMQQQHLVIVIVIEHNSTIDCMSMVSHMACFYFLFKFFFLLCVVHSLLFISLSIFFSSPFPFQTVLFNKNNNGSSFNIRQCSTT